MLKVGVTGGIGSGKSTVCKIFECLGIPVFHADEAGRNLLSEDMNVIEKVMQLMGACIITDGKPDRKKIAEIVFREPEKLTALNAIIHPAVRNAFHFWLSQQKSDIVIEEAAILFESGAYKDLDKVIMVYAPEDIRIARIMKRDNLAEEQVKARMKNQWDEEKKKALSDYVIVNDDKELLIPQVMRVYKEMRDKI